MQKDNIIDAPINGGCSMAWGFDYSALSSLDFEHICKDVLEQMTNVKLRVFAEGKDKGIDIDTKTIDHSIVGQCKRYCYSSTASLNRDFQKSVKAFKKHYPDATPDYYLFVSKDLSASEIANLVELSDGLLINATHVITKIDIDVAIAPTSPGGIRIIQSNPVLFGYAAVWDLLFNQNHHDENEFFCFSTYVKEHSPLFVQTSVFYQAKKILYQNRGVFLVGDPGSGKTITSKMLAMDFLAGHPDYSLIIGSNSDTNALFDKCDRNKKQLILLDDFLGVDVYRFKQTDAVSFQKLINVSFGYPNTFVIVNSRQTVLNDAKSHGDKIFVEALERFPLEIVNCNTKVLREKEEILYRHIVNARLPIDYVRNVCLQRRFRKIALRYDFNPRVIEKAVDTSFYQGVDPSVYTENVLNLLSHPSSIWESEFNERLSEDEQWILYTIATLGYVKATYEQIEEAVSSVFLVNGRAILRGPTLLQMTGKLCDSFLRCDVTVRDAGIRRFSFVNPSVYEVVKSFVFSPERSGTKNILEKAAVFYEQKEFLRPEYSHSSEYLTILRNGNPSEIHSLNEQDNYVRYIFDLLDHPDLISPNPTRFFEHLRRPPHPTGYLVLTSAGPFVDYIRTKCDRPVISRYFLDSNSALNTLHLFLTDEGFLNLCAALLEVLGEENKRRFVALYGSMIRESAKNAAQDEFDELIARQSIVSEPEWEAERNQFIDTWNEKWASLTSAFLVENDLADYPLPEFDEDDYEYEPTYYGDEDIASLFDDLLRDAEQNILEAD